MKKALAILLSCLLVFTAAPMAFAAEKTVVPADAYAPYDAQKVASQDGAYIAGLSYDQLAGILLDWLDAKIDEKAAAFNSFEIEAFGQTVAVDLDVHGVDGLLRYVDHLADLGGDFARMDISALQGKSRAGGDINLLFAFIDFMADNSALLGKVFSWTPETVFDYGKVGEYIETLPADDGIRTFYEDYLISGDIQTKFVAEIAREMGYTPAEGETFDEIINNGVKAKAIELFGKLLSEDSVAALNDNDRFDLRTTDAYTLVKNFIGLLQNDNKPKLDEALAAFLAALQGAVRIVGDNVNLEPPTVTIGDFDTVVGTYHPASAEPEDYMPTIYTSATYKAAIDAALGADSPAAVTDEPVPEDVAALIAGEGTDLDKAFVMVVKQGDEVLQNIELDFADIEALARQAALELGNQMAASMGATITDVSVAFDYKAYASEDAFVMQVSVANVSVSATMTFNGITIPVNNIDVSSAVTNPVATIAVKNLSGTIGELETIRELLGFIDTEAEYDDGILDVMANYDAYNGAVGQVNRILCDALKNVTTDAGYADLGLVEGGNENLTANLQKLCDKVSAMLDTVRKYIPRDEFIALADAADIGAGFTSSHGFNAGMIYDMDFSSVENELVCGIRLGCDLLVEDDPDSILYDFHLRVEDLETLDAMLAAGADMLLEKLAAKFDPDYAYTPVDYAAVGEDGAKDAVMSKAVDVLYAFAGHAVEKANGAANELIADVNARFGLDIGTVVFKLGVEKSGSWQTTLSALVDRFLKLTNGLMLASGDLDGMKDVWGRINGIAAAALPMSSIFSGTTNVDTIVNDYLFEDAADGDLAGLLSLFEVKEDALAENVPVTKALINASDHIVDAFFPDTVQAENYEPSPTVQQEFTGSANDAVIAANNMVSIAARKAHVVPALLDLVRESGLLPAFCGGPSEPGDPGTPDTPVVPDEPVDPVEPGDPDDGGNGGALSGLKSFFERIASFFRRIVDFFRNLFNR